MKLSLILLVLAATVIASSIDSEVSSVSVNNFERRGISSFFSNLFGGGGSSNASTPSSGFTTSPSSGSTTSPSRSSNSQSSTVSSRRANGQGGGHPASGGGGRTSSSGGGISGDRASSESTGPRSCGGDTYLHYTEMPPVFVGGYVPTFEDETYSQYGYKSGAGSIFPQIEGLALAATGAAGVASIFLMV